KHLSSYIALLLIFGFGTWLVLRAGAVLYVDRQAIVSSAEPSAVSHSPVQPDSVPRSAVGAVHHNLRDSLSILLLQLVVIIVAARLVGTLFQKIGQPPVLGEIVAGILLGPSLLGWLAPQVVTFIFPASSMEILKLLSQIGVVLFMFVVGMELDVRHLRQRAHTAVMVSHASIIVPFFLGVTLALVFYRSLAPASTSFSAFALFMGIAMSVTAFPVLARILEDRRMSQTYLGSIALTCAAVDDVTAWCMLALVIAFTKSGSVAGSLVTIGLALGFAALMLLVVKRQLARVSRAWLPERPNGQEQSRTLLAVTLAFLLACALLTESIGIHSLFGAFLAGVVMPPDVELRTLLKEKLEPLTAAALLPLFFAFTGLRLQIGLLNDWQGWAICAVIVAVAIAGKLGSSMLMARWCGMNWQDAFSLGALMNTRGLVELIVLNIGYDLGILSGRSFAMLVLMALITTFMTGPLVSLVRSEKTAQA
ncbi:MAG TPA: cation:proton antiporter, partial [Pyrinomonadaceae bacterium]|nr:cation:proton antiporter [Pyrinomonadaceae bacterium]